MKISDQKRKLIFLVIVISTIVTSMLSTALTTALPAIIKDLHIEASTGQWLTSLFSLVMGIFVLCTSFLIKKFPTKILYVSSLAIIVVGLLVDVFAQTFQILMIGRILQAAGNGVLMALAQVILLTIYPSDQRGEVMGIYGLAVGAAPIVAPTVAGIIVDIFGWKMIFIFASAICVLAFFVALFVFENVLQNEEVSFDMMSLALCSIAYIALTLGAGNIGRYGFISLNVMGALIIGFASGYVFVKRQQKLEKVFLDVSVFKSHHFRIAVIGSMLMYAVLIAVSILQPIYIQSICGYSATISGLIAMPGSIVMTIMNPFVGKLYDRIGIKKLFTSGALLLLLSSCAFAMFKTTTPIAIISGVNVLRNMGIACIMMPLVTFSVSQLETNKVSAATSLLTSLRTVAGSIGAAVFVAIATTTSNASIDIRGLNITSMGIMAVCLAIFIVAVFGLRNKVVPVEYQQ